MNDKDKHYHYLVVFFVPMANLTSNRKFKRNNKMRASDVVELEVYIARTLSADDVVITGFFELECKCDE